MVEAIRSPKGRVTLLAMGLAAGLAATAVIPLAGAAIVIVVAGIAFLALTRRDAVSLLSLTIATAFILPARYAVVGLGPAGVPAVLIGLFALFWWFAAQASPESGVAHGLQPIRIALLIFGCACLIGAAAAFAHPLSGSETNQVERTLITYGAFFGVAFLAADGIGSRERLDTLMRRLVWAGVFLGLVGILQFVVRIDPYAHLQIPGFQEWIPTSSAAFLRGAFQRAIGTTEQPIEYASVLTALLPIAVHYAMQAPRERRLRDWIAVAVILFAIPLSVSRTALVGLAVGLAFLAAAWSWRRRLNALLLAVLGFLAARIVAPGLVGTFYSLVVNSSQDNSIIGRTDRYPLIERLFYASPIYGSGLGRDRPSLPFVDNQYLSSLIDGGTIGLVALLVLLVIAISTARGARHRSTDPSTRSLGQAMAASIAVVFATFVTYDGLSFRVASLILFIVIGASGALWRLVQSPAPAPELVATGAEAVSA
ncbi:MAG TPA: O-antigen ligase family protein [Candidatus Dormibacteraeota bacterium]|nr:O-antigen ligase family protein [Candidatus Dormibacteraeota bacterium]